jgi:hypothetical protein
LPRRKELLIKARQGITNRTPFERRIQLIMSGVRDAQIELFMGKLKHMKVGIEKESRGIKEMQNVQVVRLMDQATLERWISEPLFRQDGLPWDQ